MRISHLIIWLVFSAIPCWGVDISTDTGEDMRLNKEKSLSIKGHIERKVSKGARSAKSGSRGKDLTRSETIRSIGQSMQSDGLDITLPLLNVFSAEIAVLERKGLGIFAGRLLTNPRLPSSFGLAAEVRPGVISLTEREFLDKSSANNVDVATITNEEEIVTYIRLLGEYGAVIGQAYLYLANDISKVKGSVTKGSDGSIRVSGIGYDDFAVLARGALLKAVSTGPVSDAIRSNLRLLNSIHSCQFDGVITTIKCGPALINLGAAPKLRLAGQPWFGDGFAGFSGVYRLSSSWSYNFALERLRTDSAFSRFAAEWSSYSEKLEAQGKFMESVLAKKKAWDLARSGKISISPGRFLPGSQ